VIGPDMLSGTARRRYRHRVAPPSERIPNRILRTIRLELNLSQDEFAAVLRDAGRRLGEPNDASKRLVQRWESGETASARPVYRRALEAVTGRAYTSLGFAERRARNGVQRRTVLGAGALAAAGLFAESAATGRRVGAELVEALAARTARLRSLDDHLGGADTYRTYAGELEATADLLRDASYTPETGRRLVGVFAEQAQQAGWASFDAGVHPRAEQLFLASLEAARTAGDTALAGNALALLAYQQNQTGHDSVETAAAAYREAGADAPSGARVLLAQRLAWAHAAAGQHRPAQHALEVAEAHLHEADGRPVPDWAAWADEREQRIISGRCWAELGRPLRAVPILESVLAEYEDSHARDKSLYLTWLAGAYADAGEVEAAAVTTARALDLSANVASARPAKRAAVVLQRLERHRALPAVRELLERAAV
jgi:DNA-binding transcriptional regulator YiaG